MTPSLDNRVTATLMLFSLISKSQAAMMICLIEISRPCNPNRRSTIKSRAFSFAIVIVCFYRYITGEYRKYDPKISKKSPFSNQKRG